MANIRSIRQQDVFFGSGVSNTGPERRSVEKPLLYQAAESGDMSMLENLLAKGTDLDLESRHGTFSETALHAASDAGHLNVVKRLLEHGANLESRDSRDKTALHTASEAGHLDIVKWLLEHGADLESTNYQDKTALYIASESGQLEILQFLLQNHAKPDSIATYENQRNALHIASINGHLEIVELLLKNNLDPNVADRLEETALHHAAENGHSAVVKCLLDNGSKIDAGNWKKDTPLHLAASKLYTGHVDVVEVLIQSFNHPPSRAEYINKPNEYKETGLHRTASAGGPDLHKVKVIELLIRSGADLGARDYEGRTPLHKACVEHAGLDVMISLFNHSHVEINQLNGPQKGLQTCLHMAVEPPRIDIVRWLLENMSAAAVQLKDSENRSAWDKACEPLAWQKRHLFDTDTVRVMSAFVCRDRKVGRGRLLMDWGTRRNLGDSRHFDLPINSEWALFALACDLEQEGATGISRQGLELLLRDFQVKQHSNKALKFREPACLFETISPGRTTKEPESKTTVYIGAVPVEPTTETHPEPSPSDYMSDEYLSIVMPYFHFQTLERIDCWRDIGERDKTFESYLDAPIYCRSGSPATFAMHVPLTLDEYTSPVLSKAVLDRRNEDQVLVRIQKREKSIPDSERAPGETKLVVVNQLWLYYIQGVLITSPVSSFFQVQWHVDIDGVIPRGIHIPSEVKDNGDLVQTAEDRHRRIGILISHLVSFLDQPSEKSFSEPLLNVFEKSITLVSEEVNTYVQNIEISTISIEEEKKFLHQISDIREELSMIRRVLFQQEDVWKDFASNAWPKYWPNGRDGRMIIAREDWIGLTKELRDEWKLVLQAQSYFGKYRQRIMQLDEDADRVERTIITKLDLKQKHASLHESHATAVMSAAVFGFTIVTIIFTPLSFLMSLFSLPIDQFQKHQVDSPWTTGTRMYSTNYIGKWTAIAEIVSVAIAIAAMWVAIDRGMGEPLTRNLKKSMLKRYERFLKSHNTGTANSSSPKVQSEKASGADASTSTEKGNGNPQKRKGLFRRFIGPKSKADSDIEAGDGEAQSTGSSKD